MNVLHRVHAARDRARRARRSAHRVPLARRLLLVASFAIAASAPALAGDLADERTIPLEEAVLRQAAARRYSPEALARFDGHDPSRPILMAVRGIVFDVSAGRAFYAAGAPYQALVGRDATRAVARMSLAEADLTDRCGELEEADWSLLERVLRDTYLAKYPVVGHLAGGAFFPKGLCCRDEGCGDC